MLHRVAGISFPAPNQILLPAGIVTSFRVGTRDVGFIHVPTMHLLEILSLLNFVDKRFTWSLSSGKVRWRREETFTFSASPTGTRVSLGEVLGMVSNRKGVSAEFIPTAAARIPPGFYQPLPRCS